jgi:phosphopantetheinyl transferase
VTKVPHIVGPKHLAADGRDAQPAPDTSALPIGGDPVTSGLDQDVLRLRLDPTGGAGSHALAVEPPRTSSTQAQRSTVGLLLADAGEVPGDDAWPARSRPASLSRLRLPRRRSRWRLGGWAARVAVGAVLGLPAVEVELRAAAGGAPEPLRSGLPLPAAVSISHRAGRAVCAVATPPLPVGCDLELIEARAGAFAAEWSTTAERELVASSPPGERDLLVALIRSGKKSALKVRRCRLRDDLRALEVSPRGGEVHGWRRLGVHDAERGADLDAWWLHLDRLVLTVAAPCLPAPPTWIGDLAAPGLCPVTRVRAEPRSPRCEYRDD